jgi:allantoicase
LAADGEWIELLPRTDLLPDTRHRFLIDQTAVVSEARLDIYPDGGLARLRMFGDLA